MNAKAKRKNQLLVLSMCIRSSQASLVYEKDPAQIKITKTAIAKWQEEYKQLQQVA